MLSEEVTETVTIRTMTGSGARGPAYADPLTTRCQVDGTRKLVRDATGREVVSETTLRLDPETNQTLNLEALFVPASLVSVRGGPETTLITAKPHLELGQLVYLEVTLA